MTKLESSHSDFIRIYFIKIYWYILSSCNDDKKLGVRIKLLYTPNHKRLKGI